MTKPRGAGKPYTCTVWTDEAKARLAAMWRTGSNDQAIADATGLSLRAVAQQRSKQGLVKRRKPRGKPPIRQYRDHVLIAEMRRRGYSVIGPDGDEPPVVDPREWDAPVSGGMLL